MAFAKEGAKVIINYSSSTDQAEETKKLCGENAEIMKAAATGDVAEANYKMIAALAVKKGDLEKSDVATFPKVKGVKGYAPIQGHIPSGVPPIGYFRNEINAGKMNRCMVIGKGSLFLGRLTNLFDGVSFVIEKNDGKGDNKGGTSEEEVKGMIASAMKEFAETLLK